MVNGLTTSSSTFTPQSPFTPTAIDWWWRQSSGAGQPFVSQSEAWYFDAQLTHTHAFKNWWNSHKEQFVVYYFAHGHLNMLQLPVRGGPSLPPLPHPILLPLLMLIVNKLIIYSWWDVTLFILNITLSDLQYSDSYLYITGSILICYMLICYPDIPMLSLDYHFFVICTFYAASANPLVEGNGALGHVECTVHECKCISFVCKKN